MIITVKNLQQQTFTIEFEPEKTILELKEKIFAERGSDYNVQKQKLIYAGVILDDDRTISSYSVDEKKFIVVMLKREVGGTSVAASIPKPSDESINTRQELASTVTSDLANTRKSTSDEQKPKTTVDGSMTVSGTTNVTSQQSLAESTLLMGEEYNRSVESMCEMGYSRDMVERAMAASFNNPERAVEYLISGIPETEYGFNANGQSINALQASDLGRGGGSGIVETDRLNRVDTPRSESTVSGGESDDVLVERTVEGSAASRQGNTQDPFEFLRTQPQFLQMRSLVYQNPDLLHAVLQQIAHTNPALLQLITENQDAFLNMLNQPAEELPQSGGDRLVTAGRRTQQPRVATPMGTSAGSGSDVPSGGGQTTSDNTTQTIAGDNGAVRRAAVADSFLRDRAAAAAAVADLTAAATAAIERDVGAGVETGSGGGGGGGGRGQGTDSFSTTILLSPQDRDAIDRLKQLGFPEALVLQAYFACDKDEQLAANFLVNTSFDD